MTALVELLHLRLRRAGDVARARQRTSVATRLLDVDPQAGSRLATAMSELCRAGAAAGSAHVTLHAAAGPGELLLRIELVCDDAAGLALGTEARRSVDQLVDEVETLPAGLVASTRLAPWTGSALLVEDARAALLLEAPGDLLRDVQDQNDALTAALVAVRDREADLRRLNGELEQTNRGVVALYAELEQRAEQVRLAQRLVFEELEGALRPAPPEVGGVELDVRYLPAEAGSPTGGDLYDWFVLRDGRLHVTVVDAVGHGVTSTRDALLVTHAVRTLVLEGHELGEVLTRVDALLQDAGDVVATVLLAQLDPRTGRLHLAGGGHPPALLVPRAGPAGYLEAGGRPVGYPLAGSDGVTERDLAPGDLVLLYTDGLIEVRKDVVEGLDTLARGAAARAGSPTAELLDGLLRDAAQGAAFNDDSLLLSLRWQAAGPHAAAPGSEHGVVLVPGPTAVPQARQEVRRHCGPRVPRPVLEQLDVVVSELVSNAARHGGSGQLQLHVEVLAHEVRVGVSDSAAGRPVVRAVGPDEEHGRGMLLVEQLSSAWGVLAQPPGKQVWASIDW